MAELVTRLQRALGDRYRVQRELGRGGMATVFLAEDLRHHRPVAIKVFDPEVAPAAGSERFLREIETVSRLTHPHILPLHDSGIAEGLAYYVMPWVAGESLRQRLAREPQLPAEEALGIAHEVADALEHAHRHGVVHRDIKPENVLLEEGHAIVADFGIARILHPATGDVTSPAPRAWTLTAAGYRVGTPAYMSPEQAAGEADVDGRSDQYALGCVTYEMLAGQPPFMGPTASSVLLQHLNATPPMVTAVRPALPPAVNAVLAKAMAKSPADRYASPTAFTGALARSLQATAAPAARPAPRRSVRVAALAALLMLVALSALAAWRQWWPFAAGGDPPPARKDWILVAEFAGPPGDPSLARAARELVSAAIDQSAGIATVPPDQIRLGLERAGKPDSLPLTPQLAREIAYRGTVRAVLEGEVVALGGRYTVTLRVNDVEEDKPPLTLTDVARSPDDLIPLLRRMGARVTDRLERGPQILRTMRIGTWPVATRSFEAYRRWADAIQLYDEGDLRGAYNLNREALALDPEFGAAWSSQSFVHMRLGWPDSALADLAQALRHPQGLTPTYRLYLGGVNAMWRGDVRVATETYERVVRLYPTAPETQFALNNWSMILMSEGRFAEGLELSRRSESGPFGSSQTGLQVTSALLVTLGRLGEARRAMADLREPLRRGLELDLALAAGAWDRAESLATAPQPGPGAGSAARPPAPAMLAQVAAARGDLGAAAGLLERAETLVHERGGLAAARLARPRVLLALMSGRPVPRAAPWLERDSTTRALITRAYVAAASGDTTTARRLLVALRARSTTRLGAHGSTPEFIEACIAARAARWNDVLSLIEQPARAGSDRGRGAFDPIAERIGTAPERWLVAQAYERLGRPDSAAAFYERMLGPEQPSVAWTGLVHSFVLQRLAVLDAGRGRAAEARQHLAALERDATRPDADMRRLLDEARVAVAGAPVTTARVARPR